MILVVKCSECFVSKLSKKKLKGRKAKCRSTKIFPEYAWIFSSFCFENGIEVFPSIHCYPSCRHSSPQASDAAAQHQPRPRTDLMEGAAQHKAARKLSAVNGPWRRNPQIWMMKIDEGHLLNNETISLWIHFLMWSYGPDWCFLRVWQPEKQSFLKYSGSLASQVEQRLPGWFRESR